MKLFSPRIVDLFFQLLERDVRARYRGSVLGVFWSFVTPLLSLAVFTFVFGYVFKLRWGGADGVSPPQTALFIFVGLLYHAFLSEVIVKATSLIKANTGLVKRAVFPLQLLSAVSVASASLHLFVAFMAVLALIILLPGAELSPNSVFVVIVFFPMLLFGLGVSWFLASLSVYLRDVTQITTPLTQLLLFLSPVFYPVKALPEAFQAFVYVNPLAPTIEQSRRVLLDGLAPEPWVVLSMTLYGGLVMLGGYFWFTATQRGFADVL